MIDLDVDAHHAPATPVLIPIVTLGRQGLGFRDGWNSRDSRPSSVRIKPSRVPGAIRLPDAWFQALNAQLKRRVRSFLEHDDSVQTRGTHAEAEILPPVETRRRTGEWSEAPAAATVKRKKRAAAVRCALSSAPSSGSSLCSEWLRAV